MAHWIGAVVCALVAAYTTQGKGKNLPLASVLAGAAIVLSFKPFSGRRSTDDHNDASKDTEMEMNVNGTTLKDIHVKVNQNSNVAEATKVLRVPAKDEVTRITLDSVIHLEVHSKKHGEDENENGNSCMVSVLDSTSHLNSSRSDVEVKFEKTDHVVIIPQSSVEKKEDEHQSLEVEHIVCAPQESVSESGSVLEESSPHESSGSSVTKVLIADGSRKENHRFVEPSQEFEVSESGNVLIAEQKEEFVESFEECDVPEFCNLKAEHVEHTRGTTTLHEGVSESRDLVEVTNSVGNKELESVDEVHDFSKEDTESSQEPDDVLDIAKATAVKRLENAVENHHIDDTESQQSVGSNECSQPKGHSRTLSDTASSSSMAIDTKDNTSTLHSLDQKALSGSESCASSFSLPSSRVYPESRSESEPRSPKSYVTVGSYYYEGGEDHTAESSPMIMSTKSKSTSGTIAGSGNNLSASARAAQEERLQAYDAYLEDPTLSPSIKKQVLRARKIALQRLALG